MRTTALPACLLLTLGCKGPPPTQACSADQVAAALQSLVTAITPAQACATDADCVLLSTPCGFTTECNLPFVAVAKSSEVAVEHQISVIQAEICGTCTGLTTPQSEINPGCTNGACCLGFGVTAGQCLQSSPDGGTCVVIALPAALSFEASCGFACDALTYCAVDAVSLQCLGWPGHIVLLDAGTCTSITTNSGGTFPCMTDADCTLGESCMSPGEPSSCFQGCNQQPSCNVAAGCVEQSGNHVCNVCVCPACPNPDGGPSSH